jgi:hypothetical protein
VSNACDTCPPLTKALVVSNHALASAVEQAWPILQGHPDHQDAAESCHEALLLYYKTTGHLSPDVEAELPESGTSVKIILFAWALIATYLALIFGART